MIDKDAIMAKIKKRYEYWREKEFNSHSIESEIRMSECQHLMLLLNTIETKETDLDKELFNWYNKEKHTDYNASILYEKYNKTLKKLIKHFFCIKPTFISN